MVESQPPNNPAYGLSPLRGTFVGRQQQGNRVLTKEHFE